jgi:hypothetical protein
LLEWLWLHLASPFPGLKDGSVEKRGYNDLVREPLDSRLRLTIGQRSVSVVRNENGTQTTGAAITEPSAAIEGSEVEPEASEQGLAHFFQHAEQAGRRFPSYRRKTPHPGPAATL